MHYLISAAIFTITSAAPTLQPTFHISTALTSRQARCEPPANVLVTFMGATPADMHFGCVPLDRRLYAISDNSSISHVALNGGVCTFAGIDGLRLTVPGPEVWDVGPPQRLVSVTCCR